MRGRRRIGARAKIAKTASSAIRAASTGPNSVLKKNACNVLGSASPSSPVILTIVPASQPAPVTSATGAAILRQRKQKSQAKARASETCFGPPSPGA